MLHVDEIALIEGCRKSHRYAQKVLYERYSNDMFEVCLLYATDYAVANDLLQEGFLKVFQNIKKFKQQRSLGGWIRTVMVNNCIDHIRADKWTKNRERLANLENHQNIKTSPIALYERDDFLNITSQLPDGYRLILNMYFLEDMTHKEISAKLNITIGTTKSKLRKAKKYLKDILLRTLRREEIEEYGGFIKKVV